MRGYVPTVQGIMPSTLLQSKRYVSFVRDRDQALERIHQNTQIDLSRILFEVLYQIEGLAASLALRANSAYLTQQVSKSFEEGTLQILTQAFPVFVQRLIKMRKDVFILTYVSELEAIGRATKRRKHFDRNDFKKKIQDAQRSPTLLGPLDKRTWLDMMALRHRIVHAFEIAVTQELKPEEILSKVRDSFPKIGVYKRPPKALTRVKESKKNSDDEADQEFMDLDFIDEGDWEMVVDAYKSTDLPSNRFDNEAQWDEESGVMKYEWELEQEATEDFVKQVRDAQVDAANALGVQDFVWIAIIDKKTCDYCCLPRAGKTSSEIEAMLASGELDPDECDAIVAPGHFNCRCQVGPVASVDEVEGPDWASFNDWLEAA